MSASKISPSKMSPTKKKASLDCAHELLTSGKRNLLVTAVPAAVNDLAECCEIVSKTCGQTADECAENGVLGNALEGVDVEAEDKMVGNDQVEDPEKMSKDEKLEVEEKVADALEENFEQHDKVAKLHAPETDENIESEDSAMEESSQDEGEDGNKMETAEKIEEVGNLQLAWEMLELAKVVYTRMAASATGERKHELEAIASTSWGIENENYVQAVADLTVCLEKRKITLPSDSRSTAEAWAILNHAIGVLESRITNLDKMERIINLYKMEKSDNIAKEVESDNIAKEVADLRALVTEIKEITDDKTMETETIKISKDPAFAGSRSAEKKASTIGIKKAAAVGTA